MDENDEQLLTGETGRLAGSLALGWLAVQLGRQALPPLLPYIIDDLSVSSFEAGLSLTVLFGLYALTHYPGGRLSDLLTRKTVIVAGLGLTTVGFGVLSVTTTYAAFLLAAAVIGLGSGFYNVPMRALLSDLFVEKRGQAIGINIGAGWVGSIASPGLVSFVLLVAVWQLTFVPVVVLLASALLLVHLFDEHEYVVERVEFDTRATIVRVFTSTRTRWLVVSYSLVMLSWRGFVGFLPTFLIVEKGLPPLLANGTFAALFVTGMVSSPVAGRVSDEYERPPVAAGALLLGSVGLVTIVFSTSIYAVLIGSAITAIGFLSFPTVIQTYLMDHFPEDNVGGDFGMFETVYSALGSVGPIYVGFVAGRIDYSTAFLGFLPCLLISLWIVLTKV